jgi:hypothetical protein
MDATQGSTIRILLYAVFSGGLTSKPLALVKCLNDRVCRFALLDREWTSLGGVQQVCDVIVRVRDLPTILDPRLQSRNTHFTGPLVTNYQLSKTAESTPTRLHHLQSPWILSAISLASL